MKKQELNLEAQAGYIDFNYEKNLLPLHMRYVQCNIKRD